MSFDRKIDQICTHRVVEEALFLNADFQTLRPLRHCAWLHPVWLSSPCILHY